MGKKDVKKFKTPKGKKANKKINVQVDPEPEPPKRKKRRKQFKNQPVTRTLRSLEVTMPTSKCPFFSLYFFSYFDRKPGFFLCQKILFERKKTFLATKFLFSVFFTFRYLLACITLFVFFSSILR